MSLEMSRPKVKKVVKRFALAAFEPRKLEPLGTRLLANAKPFVLRADPTRRVQKLLGDRPIT